MVTRTALSTANCCANLHVLFGSRVIYFFRGCSKCQTLFEIFLLMLKRCKETTACIPSLQLWFFLNTLRKEKLLCNEAEVHEGQVIKALFDGEEAWNSKRQLVTLSLSSWLRSMRNFGSKLVLLSLPSPRSAKSWWCAAWRPTARWGAWAATTWPLSSSASCTAPPMLTSLASALALPVAALLLISQTSTMGLSSNRCDWAVSRCKTECFCVGAQRRLLVLYCFADFGERSSPLTLLSAESVFSSTVIVMKNVSTVLFLLNAQSDFVCGVVVCVYTVCVCVLAFLWVNVREREKEES